MVVLMKSIRYLSVIFTLLQSGLYAAAPKDLFLNQGNLSQLISQILPFNSNFGSSIAISGEVALVGAPSESEERGAVYVFRRAHTAGNWTLHQRLVSNPSHPGDKFGSSVAVHNNRILIGSPGYDVPRPPYTPYSDAGAAYVFTLTTTGLYNQLCQFSIQSTGLNLGTSVAVHSNHIALGAPQSSNTAGAVYTSRIIHPQGSATEQCEALVTHRPSASFPLGGYGLQSGDRFGAAVALSENTLAVSAPGDDGAGAGANHFSNEGAVYLYKRSDPSQTGLTNIWWTPDTTVRVPRCSYGGTITQALGSQMALSNDTLVASSPDHRGTPWLCEQWWNAQHSIGMAFVFKKSAAGWSYSQALSAATPDDQDQFGASLAIAGNRIAIGAVGDDGVSNLQSNAGAVYLFERLNSGADFNFKQVIRTSSSGLPFVQNSLFFGRAVALDSQSHNLMIGSQRPQPTNNPFETMLYRIQSNPLPTVSTEPTPLRGSLSIEERISKKK